MNQGKAVCLQTSCLKGNVLLWVIKNSDTFWSINHFFTICLFIEQLKARLNLNVDNIDKLTEDELKAQVDSAVGQIVNPLKMKSQLVDQLQTQITDLEMFIDFLQGEASTILPGECNGCG